MTRTIFAAAIVGFVALAGAATWPGVRVPFVSAAQQIQEPPEMPPGQVCERPNDWRPNPDHPCQCRRECMDGDVERPTHDPHCAQWCHEDHCACPMDKCP